MPGQAEKSLKRQGWEALVQVLVALLAKKIDVEYTITGSKRTVKFCGKPENFGHMVDHPGVVLAKALRNGASTIQGTKVKGTSKLSTGSEFKLLTEACQPAAGFTYILSFMIDGQPVVCGKVQEFTNEKIPVSNAKIWLMLLDALANSIKPEIWTAFAGGAAQPPPPGVFVR